MRGFLTVSFLLLLITGLGMAPARGDTAISETFLKLRDPFKRPVFKDTLSIPKSDLELFATEEFKMVGAISGPDHKRAMLQGPNGKNYLVSENTKIGLRKGVITKITAQSVQVREQVMNVLGNEEPVGIDLVLGGEKAK